MADSGMHIECIIDKDDFNAAGEASSKVKKSLSLLGVSPRVIKRIAVAMYEVEINMVIHANGGRAEVEVTLDQIVLKMIDEGPGIPDVAKAMEEGYSTAGPEVRSLGFGAGMGLPNMKRYSDEMNIETEVGKGTVVTMKRKIG